LLERPWKLRSVSSSPSALPAKCSGKRARKAETKRAEIEAALATAINAQKKDSEGIVNEFHRPGSYQEGIRDNATLR
jgi:hypothetical protein